ncbi:MAG: glycosyltransferase family 2 protein [Gemmatimonadales bacterium]|nr:MAG: glycosyltransferase family 2 protein [Gemmatimonadales bacterium]
MSWGSYRHGCGSVSDGSPRGALIPERLRRDFAVVVPAFNEAPVAVDLVRELKATFERHGLEGEVLVVDDGSDDGTAEVIEREAEGWDALRVLRHPKNLGKTEALQTAARMTDREVLVLFDADLQHSTEEIPRFLGKMGEGWDIVCGRKVGSYDKRAVSSVYNRLSRRIFRVPASDLNSMKAFRQSVLDEIHLRHDWHRFFVVLAHARGHSVTEIDIELYPRRAGTSKYTGPWRVMVGLMDLFSVWFLLIFSRKPLLLFGTVGVLLMGLGVLVGIVAIWLRFVHGFGFRPLLTLVLLLETVGVTLFGFGLLAEMVAQLRQEVEALRRRERK